MIAAEGEQKASKALKEAADVLQQSPSALQVDHEYEDDYDNYHDDDYEDDDDYDKEEEEEK